MVLFLLGLVGTQDLGHDARRLDVAQARTVEIGIVHRHAHVAVSAVNVALVKQAVGNRPQRRVLSDAAFQVTLGALDQVLHLVLLVVQLRIIERHRARDDGVHALTTVVVVHQFGQQLDGTLGLVVIRKALGLRDLVIDVVMGHIDGYGSSAHLHQLLHILLGILRALHILSLINQQVGQRAVIHDELAGRQARGINLIQRLLCLVHQARGGKDMGQVQAALVQQRFIAHRLSQAYALVHIGISRIVLVSRVLLIEPFQRGIAPRSCRLLAQIGLQLCESGLLGGDNLGLRSNQAVETLKTSATLCSQCHNDTGHHHRHKNPNPPHHSKT